MKLPGQGYKTGVQRLAHISPASHLAEANARLAFLGEVGGFAERYQARETERQIQEATLKTHQDRINFQEEYGGRPNFNAMDQDVIDNPAFTQALSKVGVVDTGELIPAYRIMPELTAETSRTSFTSNGSIIKDKEARENWLFQQKQFTMGEYEGDVARAQKQQIAYSVKQTEQAVDTFMLNKDYGGAELAIRTGPFDEATQEKMISEVTTQKQEDDYNEVLEKRDLPQMEIALASLAADDPLRTSHLDTQKQKVYANALRIAIGQETKQEVSKVNTQLKLDRDDAASIINTWESGGKTDPQYVDRIYTSIKSDEENNPVLVRNFERAMAFQPHLVNIMTAPPQAQYATLDRWKSMSSKTPEDQYAIDHLERSMAEGAALRQKDMMEYGAKWEGMQIAPMDYGNLIPSLKDRQAMATSLQGNYGLFTGYLRANEVTELGDQIKNASFDDKLLMFGQVNVALGDKAGVFYEQLKREGIETSAAIAGQIVAEEGVTSTRATGILRGSAIRREDPTWISEAKKDIMAQMASEYGTLFGGNVVQRKAIEEATLDAYAYLAESKGKKDIFDSDLYEEASRMATGGLVEFNNSTIVAPKGNVNTKVFGKWMKDIKPEVLGGAMGYSGEQMKSALNTGDLNVVGKGKGKYYLQTNQGDYVYSAPGIPYVLNYSDNPADVNESRSLWQKIKDQADWARKNTYDIPRSGTWDFEKGGL